MADAGLGDHMVVGPDDHRAYIVITAIVGLTWSLLVLAIRLFIRLRLTGPFGFDDAAASLATFIAACQTAVTLYSVREGVGVRYNDAYRDSVDAGLKAYYASMILYIMALCPAKASMSLLISRVSRQAADKHLLATHIVTAIILAWGLASIFIVAFQCGGTRPWDVSVPSRCPNLFPRWLAVEVPSLAIEILIAGLAVSLVLGLEMAFRTKLVVVLAFSAQLLVAIPVSYRLVLLRDATSRPGRLHHASAAAAAAAGSGSPAMFALALPTIVTQVVMHFSVMAATFPCFRQFLQAFNSDFGATTKMGTDDERSGVRSCNSYAMSVLRSRGEGGELAAPLRGVDSDTEVDEAMFRPRAPLRDGVLTPVDDGRSMQSVASDRAMIQHKQKRV